MGAPFAESVLSQIGVRASVDAGRRSSAGTTAPAPATSGATAQTSGFVNADKDTPAAPATSATSATSGGSGQPPVSSTSAPAPSSAVTSQFGFMALPTQPMGGFQPIYSGGGGGLGSSPNVPKPGTSIDPKTGKPYTAGLTRAELEAVKAKGAGLLDPTPQTDQARRSSTVKSQFGVLASGEALETTKEGRRLSDLTGREQAARQLAGSAVAGDITPGQELPGGWGPTAQTSLPGSGPNAPSSVYEDIGDGLEKLGKSAYNLIPKGIKEAFNPEALDKGKQPEGQPPKARRSSVGVLFEHAKQQGEKLVHEVQETIAQGQRRGSLKPSGRASGTIGAEGGVLSQVKHFLAEAGTGAAGPVAVKAAALPSEEYTGARPGDRSGGVGALPGKSTETGVAVLPDENKAPISLPSQENQGMRPGETSAGVGALPGKGTESGVAVLPDQKAAEGNAGGLITTGTPGTSTPAAAEAPAAQTLVAAAPVAAVSAVSAAPAVAATSAREIATPSATDATTTEATVSPTTTATPTSAASGIKSGSYGGLAAALPATFIGTGAAKGATDIETTGLKEVSPVSHHSAETSSTVDHGSTLSPDVGHASDTRHGQDRTTSSASITAIRHGHEGSRPSPLNESTTLTDTTIPEKPAGHATAAATAATAGVAAAAVGEEKGSHAGLTEQAEHTGLTGATAATGATGASTGHSAHAQTKSLTPGNENDGVGHPDSRGAGTTREPGNYPAADHHGQAIDPLKEKGKSTATTPGILASEKDSSAKGVTSDGQASVSGASGGQEAKEAATLGGLGAAGTIPATSHSADPTTGTTTSTSPATTTAAAPTTPSKQLDNGHNNHNLTSSAISSPTSAKTNGPAAGAAAVAAGEKGHARTGSNASTGSNGKKKVGFMKKLKGEIKVIGGKLQNDDKKVEEGERLKHGQ